MEKFNKEDEKHKRIMMENKQRSLKIKKHKKAQNKLKHKDQQLNNLFQQFQKKKHDVCIFPEMKTIKVIILVHECTTGLNFFFGGGVVIH